MSVQMEIKPFSPHVKPAICLSASALIRFMWKHIFMGGMISQAALSIASMHMGIRQRKASCILTPFWCKFWVVLITIISFLGSNSSRKM